MFPAARFLQVSMIEFENEILNNLLDKYEKFDSVFLTDIARVHAELLYIHPFREGNGRTARLLLNLMLRKNGWEILDFTKMNEELFEKYIFAVQSASMKNYQPMIEVIELLL
ncbi:Fic family protein [Epilithonimonas hungarica]|uniref:Fic family protein n=1 Tax=Epilithonimonas hungarica TaxID=454006 RepID=UPI0027D896A5|nr:Fic family protein [Epilithonimonas hungarica]